MLLMPTAKTLPKFKSDRFIMGGYDDQFRIAGLPVGKRFPVPKQERQADHQSANQQENNSFSHLSRQHNYIFGRKPQPHGLRLVTGINLGVLLEQLEVYIGCIFSSRCR